MLRDLGTVLLAALATAAPLAPVPTAPVVPAGFDASYPGLRVFGPQVIKR